MQFINLKTQYKRIQDKVQTQINAVLEHGQYIMGPEVKELEQRLAEFVGAEYCISVASGTDALLIAMMALDIQAGDEVITSPFTFIAAAEMLLLLGAKPVFVDVDARTYNLDPLQLEAAITDKTKAIIPVSLYGQCADFAAINKIAKQYDLAVIEDAAQSFGAVFQNKKSCNLSDIGCASFFPSKPLGCYGDGGACFTNDEELANKMRRIRVHGQEKRYHHSQVGLNGRLDTLQAAILLVKLEIFPEEIIDRQKIAGEYNKLLNDHVTIPYIQPGNTSVYAQYTIQVDQRENVQKYLASQEIPSAVHYALPLHLQPVFAELKKNQNSGNLRDTFPVTEAIAQRVLSLPMDPYLTKEDIQRIVTAVVESCVL